MIELWLNFTDKDGKEHRVPVDGEKFTIGRMSSCDLSIPDGRLSREHVRIERFGDVFVLADLGSSNGTTLNSVKLTDPEGIKNNDVIDLGGVEVRIEITDGKDSAEKDKTPDAAADPGAAPPAGQPASASSSSSQADTGGFPIGLLLIPVVGVIVLLFAGALFLVLSGGQGTRAQQDHNTTDNFEDFETPKRTPDMDPKPDASPGPINDSTSGTDTTDTVPTGSPIPAPTTSGTNGGTLPTGDLGETARIEQYTALFLRRIALNDPRAFITSDQAKLLAPKIRQLSSNPALAVNLNSAKKNSTQITALAQSRNLKPQFLAVAAVTRLGNGRGDVLQTSQSMIEVLEKLTVQLNNEFADDSLLVISALEQGNAGEYRKMRDLLQKLSNKFPDSTRTIRSIWFLRQNNQISDTDFDRALTFVAIGTISQNPKEFGVNAEALTL